MTAIARISPIAALQRAALALFAAFALASCGLNSVPTAEEQVNAAWGNLQADYQRRADLIPNLVNTVKGYAQQERPAKVKAFADAQNQLGGSLGRLLATFEAYPDLKSNQNFLALQDQLEGTENRINASRRDYNEAVRGYNTRIRTFPDAIGAKIFYGAKPKVPFEAAAAAQTAPTVTFNTAG
jgi:LemA protein